jgi:hypothetical protein
MERLVQQARMDTMKEMVMAKLQMYSRPVAPQMVEMSLQFLRLAGGAATDTAARRVDHIGDLKSPELADQ